MLTQSGQWEGARRVMQELQTRSKQRSDRISSSIEQQHEPTQKRLEEQEEKDEKEQKQQHKLAEMDDDSAAGTVNEVGYAEAHARRQLLQQIHDMKAAERRLRTELQALQAKLETTKLRKSTLNDGGGVGNGRGLSPDLQAVRSSSTSPYKSPAGSLTNLHRRQTVASPSSSPSHASSTASSPKSLHFSKTASTNDATFSPDKFPRFLSPDKRIGISGICAPQSHTETLEAQLLVCTKAGDWTEATAIIEQLREYTSDDVVTSAHLHQGTSKTASGDFQTKSQSQLQEAREEWALQTREAWLQSTLRRLRARREELEEELHPEEQNQEGYYLGSDGE